MSPNPKLLPLLNDTYVWALMENWRGSDQVLSPGGHHHLWILYSFLNVSELAGVVFSLTIIVNFKKLKPTIQKVLSSWSCLWIIPSGRAPRGIGDILQAHHRRCLSFGKILIISFSDSCEQTERFRYLFDSWSRNYRLHPWVERRHIYPLFIRGKDLIFAPHPDWGAVFYPLELWAHVAPCCGSAGWIGSMRFELYKSWSLYTRTPLGTRSKRRRLNEPLLGTAPKGVISK